MAYDAAAVVGEVVVEPGAAMRVLDRTLLRGVTWTGGIKGLTLLLSWASTIVVARITRIPPITASWRWPPFTSV